MKTRTQKLISLVLVLMMLVTMIPMGIFTASAADVSIGSATEWNAVAGTIASGTTVKLTGNIDFGGAEAKPLVPASQGAVVLHFDGQGYAIKNANASAPLIAGILSASATGGNPGTETQFANASTIKNVTFEKVAVTADGDVALAVGKMTGKGFDYLFENIKVVDCDVTSTAGAAAALATVHEYGSGGSYNPSSFKAVNVTIDADTTITAKTFAAGILANAPGNTFNDNSNHFFQNIYVAATITSTYDFVTGTAAKYNAAAAGIIGYLGGSAARGVTAKFENCVVVASLLQPNATDTTHGAIGGLIGMLMGGNGVVANITTKNVALDIENFTAKSDFTAGLATVNSSKGFVLTNEGVYVKSAPTYEFYDIYGIMYLGVVADANKVSGSKKNIEKSDVFYITYDENGFVSTVSDTEEVQEEVFPEYDTTAEFVISSVADWNKIANSGKNFVGKTIKLGADIDFEGAEALPLVPASVGATTMNFDGQGYTIKNATASAPLLASSMTSTGTGANPDATTDVNYVGEMSTTANTVKNVTFQNITLSAAGDVALAIGTISGNSMDFAFANIKVVDCDVTSTAGKAAAVVAVHDVGSGSSWNRSIVTFNNVVVDNNTTITGATFVGGVVAYSSGNTQGAYGFYNVYVAGSLSSTYAFNAGKDEKGVAAVGGMIGAISKSGRCTAMAFENCAVVGSLNLTNATEDTDGALGGLFGNAILGNGAVPKISVKNVVINLADFTNVATYTGSFGTVNNSVGFVLEYANVYVVNAPANEIYDVYGNLYLFEQTEANKTTGTQKNLSDVFVVDAAKAAQLVSFDADGYVSVKDAFHTNAYQKSEAVDGKYGIRFIGLSQLTSLGEGNQLHMKVVATYAGGTKTFDTASDKCYGYVGGEKVPAPGAVLYDALTAYNGVDEKTHTAAEYGAEKLAGFTIYNIPADTEITFTATLYHVNAYGVVVEANTVTVTIPAAN